MGNPEQGMVRKVAGGDAGPSFQDFPQRKLAGRLSQKPDGGNEVSPSDTRSDILQAEYLPLSTTVGIFPPLCKSFSCFSR